MATWRYRGHCIALTLITPHVFKQYLSPFSAAKCSKLELHASMYYIYSYILTSQVFSPFCNCLFRDIFHFIQLTTVTRTF